MHIVVVFEQHTHTVAPSQICRLRLRGSQDRSPHRLLFASRSGALHTPIISRVQIWTAVLAKLCFPKEGQNFSRLKVFLCGGFPHSNSINNNDSSSAQLTRQIDVNAETVLVLDALFGF